MKISQIRDKTNIPQKVELQANLRKHWSFSQMLDPQYCLFYWNGGWGGTETIRAARAARGFGSLPWVTGRLRDSSV